MTDVEDQKDEICVLESIYTTEELKVEKDVDGKIIGQFYGFLSLPPGFKVVYKDVNLDTPTLEVPTVTIPLSHLPPVLLTFSLPADYPSASMPQFKLTCNWLTFAMMKHLYNKLKSLWTENRGMVILYIWTQFIKEDTLSFLGIKDTIDITGFYIRELKRLSGTGTADERSGKSQEESASERKFKKYRRREDGVRKKGAVGARIRDKGRATKVSMGPHLNMHLHQYLRSYSEDRARSEFNRTVYTCDICYADKLGEKCIQFKPCDHVYCKECIASYFSVRIREGSIHSMPCPFSKCPSEALQSQIREVVGAQLYSRYDRQLLSATLDQMQDITYCPRTQCQCPVLRDSEDKMTVCPSCKHVFCAFCKMTYHGVEQCRLKTEEKRKLIAEYENADEETKLRLEKRYGKKEILVMMENAKSESWIVSNSKPCPNCSVAIEKSDGCNKMSCWKCNSYFCWLCMGLLDPVLPYSHYLDPQSRCHQNLFEGTFHNQYLPNQHEFLDEDDEEFDDEDDELDDEYDFVLDEDDEYFFLNI